MKKFIGAIFFLLVFSAGCSKPVSGSSGTTIGGNFIQVEISSTSGCARSGETVKLRASAKNLGSTSALIQMQDRPVLDIRMIYYVLKGETGAKVEQSWSDGRALTADLTRLELEPGESKSIEMDWIAQPPASMRGAVEVTGLLRYGERPNEIAAAQVFMAVDKCP